MVCAATIGSIAATQAAIYSDQLQQSRPGLTVQQKAMQFSQEHLGNKYAGQNANQAAIGSQNSLSSWSVSSDQINANNQNSAFLSYNAGSPPPERIVYVDREVPKKGIDLTKPVIKYVEREVLIPEVHDKKHRFKEICLAAFDPAIAIIGMFFPIFGLIAGFANNGWSMYRAWRIKVQ